MSGGQSGGRASPRAWQCPAQGRCRMFHPDALPSNPAWVSPCSCPTGPASRGAARREATPFNTRVVHRVLWDQREPQRLSGSQRLRLHQRARTGSSKDKKIRPHLLEPARSRHQRPWRPLSDPTHGAFSPQTSWHLCQNQPSYLTRHRAARTMGFEEAA